MTKKYGFWTLTFLVVANMIGAGVFTTSGFALQDLGSPRLVVAAWVVAGAIALSGAIGYGLLVRKMPESGGEYLFLSRAAHPLLGFIAGWVSLIAGFSGAIALAASTFEAYLLPEEMRPEWLPKSALAVAVIVLAGASHGLRARVGAVAQNAVVVVKLGLLTGIILFAVSQSPWEGWAAPQAGGDGLAGWALVSAFASSLVWISLSYSGFNAAVYVAEEVDDAPRTIPKAMLAGTIGVLILYVVLNAVFVYAPPLDLVKGQEDVAAITARALGGDAFAFFVRVTIAVCLLTSVFSMLMAAPRVYAKMADDGLMPRFLRFEGSAPRAAIVAQVVLAGLLAMFSSIQSLLSYLGLTLSLSAAGSVLCLFLPRGRVKPLAHPIHLFPAFYVVATLVAGAIMAWDRPWQVVGTALTFAIGILAYGCVRWNSKRVAR